MPKALFILISLLLFSGCGPLPPEDPFNLAGAKDSLARGNHWYLRGCYREASRFFDESLAYARLSDNVALIIMSQNALGASALARGQLDVSARFLEEALELSLSEKDQPELDSILGTLGSLAFKAGRLNDAEDFWKKAVETSLDRQTSPALYYCNLARLYLDLDRKSEFVEMAQLALAASQQNLTRESVKADALNLNSLVYLENNQDDLALENINLALKLDRHTENQIGLAQDLEVMAKLLLRKERYQEAAQSLDRAFYLKAALKDRPGLLQIFSLLESTSAHGYPSRLDSYRSIIKNPELFDPLSQNCP